MPDASPLAIRFRHRLRHSRDRLATLMISASGIGVIVAVLAIGVFLAIEVVPLFASSRVTVEAHVDAPAAAPERVVWMDVDEQRRMTLLGASGQRWQGRADGALAPLAGERPNAWLAGQRITSTGSGSALVPLALGLEGGDVVLVPRDSGARLDWPAARRYALFDTATVSELRLHVEAERWWLAGRTPDGRVAVLRGDARGTPSPPQRFALPATARHLALGRAGRLVLAEEQRLAVWSLAGGSPRQLGVMTAFEDARRITALRYLAGGETLLVGDSGGGVRRWLNAADHRPPLIAAPAYRGTANAAITQLLALPDRRLALALDAEGGLALYQALAGRRWQGRAPEGTPLAWSVAPGSQRLWWLGEAGLTALSLDAEHAEVSWATLWTPVLYEGHAEPQQRWQPSVSGVESEPRFGLAPLAWGTLKAAGWALVFAVPIALGAAIHSSTYMPARLRARLRPTLELMEALPGVVVGFVAGLVMAPYVERHLAGALALVVVLPLGILLAGAVWQRLPAALRARLPLGWAGLWLVPWLALLAGLALTVSSPLEAVAFGGDLRAWLETRLGLDYASRNAMIVGLAMGFAVIPSIYALAEDALSGLPASLGEGAQALGATRWQALWRVLLPAASPGLFSAVMIGAGRAVGETMIVLMATGNTALMTWSPFEGLRSAAANIAIELPEAAVGGTHYRLLLLSALLLFVFTFCVNTLAEVVRQRLRRRYRHLGVGR